jgi:hypothetical protein
VVGNQATPRENQAVAKQRTGCQMVAFVQSWDVVLRFCRFMYAFRPLPPKCSWLAAAGLWGAAGGQQSGDRVTRQTPQHPCSTSAGSVEPMVGFARSNVISTRSRRNFTIDGDNRSLLTNRAGGNGDSRGNRA